MATSAYQSITRRATNKNAKYKMKYTYGQQIITTDTTRYEKYTYSKLITLLSPQKYSYAI